MTRILVVDDNEYCRRAVLEMLQSEGYTVAAVDNGQTALERLGGDKWDLVVSDIVMPGVDGCQVVAAARSAGIRAVAMSGTEHAIALPDGVPFLPKPFRRGQLIDAVSEALS